MIYLLHDGYCLITCSCIRERWTAMLIISRFQAQKKKKKKFCPTSPDFNQRLKIVADCNRHSEVIRGV